MLEGRAHAESTSASDGVHETREPVAVAQRSAVAVGHVRLVQPDPAGRVEGVVSGGEVVRKLLDPGLVGDRWIGVRRTGRRLGRVLAAGAVHLVDVLGLRVVRLELLVLDRPGGRDAVVVARLSPKSSLRSR